MYIRKTKVKSGQQGEAYYTYRIVESVRSASGVKQRTLINLGKQFGVAPEHWPVLVKRIEQIVQGHSASAEQTSLFDLKDQLDAHLEKTAQRYAALMIHKLSQATPELDQTTGQSGGTNDDTRYARVDLNEIDVLKPRSIGIEAIAHHALRQLHLDKKLAALGFNGYHIAAAIGNVIGRMAVPGSERSTYDWLCRCSGLGELIDHDFETMSLWRLYEVSDDLLKHKAALETHLYQREQDLFQSDRTLVLYDLTNTYFEGQATGNSKARFGRSKENRSDCPLVTLGLTLDSQGFPVHSEVFPGNASEPETLAEMLAGLNPEAATGGREATVVMDAGIASQANIDWLKAQGYHYLVVSRERHRELPGDDSVIVKQEPDNRVTVRRSRCKETGEIRLYCHSQLREKKEQAIRNRFAERFEAALVALREGLSKKGTVKKYEKVIERIGRLREKYARVAQDYEVSVVADDDKHKAVTIQWTRQAKATVKDSQAGAYCLRTDLEDWSEEQLWRTWVMLTDLEATFRSMKTELGLRPVYHQKEDRVTGHLFITLLAYHLVQTIRFQLKQQGINWSWDSIRRVMGGQHRVTVSMKTQAGKNIYLRTSTKAEADQQMIYDALGMDRNPVGRRQTVLAT